MNSGFHQYGYNFEVANRGEFPRPLGPNLAKWDVPYQLYRDEHGGRRPGSVLILGTGTGNDVAVALRNKAKRVVAVEIDPVIIELGRTTNARPRTPTRASSATVNDARQFLRSTKATFDLIVFGTLDSHSLLSSQGSLRLDNYVYTPRVAGRRSPRPGRPRVRCRLLLGAKALALRASLLDLPQVLLATSLGSTSSKSVALQHAHRRHKGQPAV